MGFNLWETLLHPDREENEHPERSEVVRAANYLQVGEFQLLQLAYWEWYGDDLPEALISKLFTDYMLKSDVPHWARHYARRINEDSDNGAIDENAAHYHRYDHDYHRTVRHGVRKFSFAVACLMLFIGGGIVLASFTVKNPASMFPPYLEIEDLPKPQKTLLQPGTGWNAPQRTPARPGRRAFSA